MLALPIGETAQPPEQLQAGVAPARLSIVFIEPIRAPLPNHRSLLSRDSYRVTTVSDTRELSHLRAAEPFAVPLINDTLGRVELDDAARSVRKQWPGRGCLFWSSKDKLRKPDLFAPLPQNRASGY